MTKTCPSNKTEFDLLDDIVGALTAFAWPNQLGFICFAATLLGYAGGQRGDAVQKHEGPMR